MVGMFLVEVSVYVSIPQRQATNNRSLLGLHDPTLAVSILLSLMMRDAPVPTFSDANELRKWAA